MPRGRAFSRHGVSVVTAFLLTVAVSVPAQAQRNLDEYEVKAAFLYNFMKFVEWPPSDDWSSTLAICVVGRGPFLEVLETIAQGKQANGREVDVRQFLDGDDPRTCHAIFVVASEARQTAAILQRVRHAAVLTVGETRQFLSDGGMVRFYVEANRVRFQIDPAGAQRAGLKVSSQLLSLAK